MSILQIRKYPDPILRKKALPVKTVTETEKRLIEDMIETLKFSGGVGLAATQVGVSKRIFVFNPSCEEWRADALINPVIVKKRGSEKKEEGCLSLPGINGEVRRSTYILVEGMDIKGKPVCFEAKDLLARIFQHEMDHLDGILFIDRINPIKRLIVKRKLKKEAAG